MFFLVTLKQIMLCKYVYYTRKQFKQEIVLLYSFTSMYVLLVWDCFIFFYRYTTGKGSVWVHLYCTTIHVLNYTLRFLLLTFKQFYITNYTISVTIMYITKIMYINIALCAYNKFLGNVYTHSIVLVCVL